MTIEELKRIFSEHGEESEHESEHEHEAYWTAINTRSTWSTAYRCSRCGTVSRYETEYCGECGARMGASTDVKEKECKTN